MRTKPFSYLFALALVLSSSMAFADTACQQAGGTCSYPNCIIAGTKIPSTPTSYSCDANTGIPLLTDTDYAEFIGYMLGSFGVGIFLGAQLRVFRVAAGKV